MCAVKVRRWSDMLAMSTYRDGNAICVADVARVSAAVVA
jgi:hypothetical protein